MRQRRPHLAPLPVVEPEALYLLPAHPERCLQASNGPFRKGPSSCHYLLNFAPFGSATRPMVGSQTNME